MCVVLRKPQIREIVSIIFADNEGDLQINMEWQKHNDQKNQNSVQTISFEKLTRFHTKLLTTDPISHNLKGKTEYQSK